MTTIALVIFLVTYAFIITEKGNRAVLALLGAVLMIVADVLDVHKAFTHYIEWNTITLLIGMMILVGITNQTGVFQYLAVRAAKLVKGNPVQILVILSLLTALLSAFLDNVTTVLLVVPLTLSITQMLGVNPYPYLISQIIASNIGGTATLIGDPPNIMIGSAVKHLTFNQFLINLAPIAFIILGVTVSLFYFLYRNQLKSDPEKVQKLMALDEKEYIHDPVLLRKALTVLGLTIVGFMLHSILHLEASVIAIGGATILMLIAVEEKYIEETFQQIEWTTIFFFVGLFTMVGALQEVGVIKYLATLLLNATNGDIADTAIYVLWGSGIASAIIDNIPFVATMIPLIQDLAVGMGYAIDSPQMDALWWSLALGACLGGNGTLIGASANVVVANMAARSGYPITYWKFLKVGAPFTLLALGMAHLYIYLRYLLFLP
ncbi:ArsB/NhaD family transporter [Risungbinella massiliensis]|uniref:ArsB/NhaD family transporter n=1 Tax=Risungbinella massiliensis TaxID=1329796 RepID=UPI0005CB952C|nr:ArsB/NhaD family transporter [Risungbinella massiliensis]